MYLAGKDYGASLMAIIERDSTHQSVQQGARGQPEEAAMIPPPTYGDLLGHPHFRRWGLRIGVSAVIGLVFALAFEIRAALPVRGPRGLPGPDPPAQSHHPHGAPAE